MNIKQMSQFNQISQINRGNSNGNVKLRHDAELSTLYGLYNNPLFDTCSENGLIGLALTGTYNPLLDFIGLEPSNVNNLIVQSLTYMGVEGTAAGTATIPWQTDPCADRVGPEWGSCGLAYNGFGKLSLKTPTRDITQLALKKCEMQPEYFVNGERITNEFHWDFVVTSKALVQALHTALVIGNKATNINQFDGLQRLVKTGYVDPETSEECTSLDSIVIDYNENGMCAATTTGITWNGVGVPNNTNLIQLVDAAINHIIRRVNMSSYGRLVNGNVVIAMPSSWIAEFLDCYVCSKYCAVTGVGLDSREARDYRESLNNGTFGNGFIRVGSLEVPIIGYDWGLINQAGTAADIYILTNKIGAQPLLRLQYNDFRALVNAEGGLARQRPLYTLDNGKILVMPSGNAGTCDSFILEMQMRLVMRAPWAQARIIDVTRSALGPAISSDPMSSVYIEQNLVAAMPPVVP